MRRIGRLFALTVTLASLVAQAPAPAPQPAPPPARLDPGLGDLHVPVTTANAEAQRYFDQGMRYLYAFNHESAVRSFAHAGELDPNLAMAHWGVALALGPNINLDVDPDREKQAYEEEQKALALASHASPREQALINALAKRYSIDPAVDLRKLSIDYSAAMGDVAKQYPKDDDIATLYAESMMDLRPWKFWTHDGAPATGTEEIVETLERVLRRNPRHIGANHYYIHAVEASKHPERALGSAKRLETLAPAAGHLVHMPAHIYQRTGNYRGAAIANERGAAADRAYVQQYGAGMYAMMYLNHNLAFGSASHAFLGDYKQAKEQAQEMADAAAAMAKEMPPVEPFVATALLVDVRFERWADVIRTKSVEAGPLSGVYMHYARGTAFAKGGNVPGAERELHELEASLAKVGDDPGFLQNSPKSLANIAAQLLEGHIAWAKGDRAAAITAFRNAVTLEDGLNYDEPADWFYPTRETLAWALANNGDRKEAAAVLREDLKRNPKNPRSVKALAQLRK